MTNIGYEHFQISDQDAKELAGGELPEPGWEKLVSHEGKNFWLKQTPVQGKQVWCICPTNWRSENGRLVLK